MYLVENITEKELSDISSEIGEAFVTNELFHEFGTIEERRDLVLKYMKIYVRCTYESKTLYSTDDGAGYIGLAVSNEKAVFPQIKMMLRLLALIPWRIAKPFMKQIKEIANEDKRYTNHPYLEVLMVCVRKEYQGQGKAKELVNFAKKMAQQRNIPLLFDTDMANYAKMYQHLGCELYHTNRASNGVTRYNLVWLSKTEQS